LTAYWAGQGGSRAPGQCGLYLLIAAGLLLIFIVSLGVSRSRAGIGLGVFAIVASAVLLWLQRGVPRIVPVLMVAGLVIGGGLVAAFALEPILQRFRDPAAEARVTMLPGVLAAVRSFFPVGSGLGSFVPIYQMFERPDTVIIPYVNHAHDDYLELAIEAGLAGLMVLLAGLTWLASASVRAVFRPANNDPNLARAAALVVLIMLVHSIVDYPLRTAALSAVFAFACALLVPPQECERVRRRRRVSGPANDASAEAANVRLPNRPSVQTSRTS
jgi:O-antigen ligase